MLWLLFGNFWEIWLHLSLKSVRKAWRAFIGRHDIYLSILRCLCSSNVWSHRQYLDNPPADYLPSQAVNKGKTDLKEIPSYNTNIEIVREEKKSKKKEKKEEEPPVAEDVVEDGNPTEAEANPAEGEAVPVDGDAGPAGDEAAADPAAERTPTPTDAAPAESAEEKKE